MPQSSEGERTRAKSRLFIESGERARPATDDDDDHVDDGKGALVRAYALCAEHRRAFLIDSVRSKVLRVRARAIAFGP